MNVKEFQRLLTTMEVVKIMQVSPSTLYRWRQQGVGKMYDERLADILLVLGWIELRWAEARALTVGDVALGDSPALRV